MIDDPRPDPTLSMPLRLVAGVAGVVVLLVSALFSVGASLFAPLGILATGAIAQRGGSRPTRGTTWVGAIIASMAALLLGAAAIFLILPPDVRRTIGSAVDSAQTVAREEQAEELARRGIDTAAVARLPESSGITVGAMVFGGMMVVGFLGVMAGSAGWVASFLLAAAFAGGWPWRGEPDPPPGVGLAGPA